MQHVDVAIVTFIIIEIWY